MPLRVLAVRAFIHYIHPDYLMAKNRGRTTINFKFTMPSLEKMYMGAHMFDSVTISVDRVLTYSVAFDRPFLVLTDLILGFGNKAPSSVNYDCYAIGSIVRAVIVGACCAFCMFFKSMRVIFGIQSLFHC